MSNEIKMERDDVKRAAEAVGAALAQLDGIRKGWDEDFEATVLECVRAQALLWHALKLADCEFEDAMEEYVTARRAGEMLGARKDSPSLFRRCVESRKTPAELAEEAMTAGKEAV